MHGFAMFSTLCAKRDSSDVGVFERVQGFEYDRSPRTLLHQNKRKREACHTLVVDRKFGPKPLLSEEEKKNIKL